MSLSPMKIFIIVSAVMILVGPDKLPEVAHKLGSTWHSLRQFQQRVEDEVRGSLPDLPSTGDIARMARNPVSMLNQLADRATSSSPSEENTLPTLTVDPHVSLPPVNPAQDTSPPTGHLSADPSLN